MGACIGTGLKAKPLEEDNESTFGGSRSVAGGDGGRSVGGGAWDASWPVSGRESELWVAAGINQDVYDHLLSEFVSLDDNGDRRLSRKEFERLSGLPEFLAMKSEDVAHLFHMVDANRSGDISFREFLNFMSKRKDHFPLQIQVLPERQRLDENMDLLGFELCATDGGRKGVDGDGNCQFSSLSWKLHGTTTKNVALRAAIVEHLRGPFGADFAAFYAPEHPSQPRTFGGYLEVMSMDRIWGDQITLQAAADAFDLVIRILTSARLDAAGAPPKGQVCGQSYGAVQTLAPVRWQQGKGEQPKEIWIAFAAQHYSPINPTSRTPQQICEVA